MQIQGKGLPNAQIKKSPMLKTTPLFGLLKRYETQTPNVAALKPFLCAEYEFTKH